MSTEMIAFISGAVGLTLGAIFATKPNASATAGGFFNLAASLGLAVAYIGLLGFIFPEI